MGRITQTKIKRISNEIYSKHSGQFGEKFDKNKKTVGKVADVPTKKLRNRIAGYLTRKTKRAEK